MVQRVLRASNFFEALGVPNGAGACFSLRAVRHSPLLHFLATLQASLSLSAAPGPQKLPSLPAYDWAGWSRCADSAGERTLELAVSYDLGGIAMELSRRCAAGEAEVKKSYRKMALKLHPDKCAAPGAAEAFKVIARAVAVLSSDKRDNYLRYGHEDGAAAAAAQRRSSAATPSGRHQRRNFEEEFDPNGA